eukprot:13844502-Ditylum_brightwellii.AAC.1
MDTALDDSEQQPLCSCSPSEFTFTLNFSQTCNDKDIPTGPDTGVKEIVYSVESDSAAAAAVPVRAVSIRIFDLGQMLIPISKFSVNGDFEDGASFRYTSITASADWDGTKNIPGGLWMVIQGRNAAGDDVTNKVILSFTNLCGIEPFGALDKL